MFYEHNLLLAFIEMVLHENISSSVTIAHTTEKNFLSETGNNEGQQQNLFLLLSYRVKPWSRKFSKPKGRKDCFLVFTCSVSHLNKPQNNILEPHLQ